jgi:hypothetical protein
MQADVYSLTQGVQRETNEEPRCALGTYLPEGRIINNCVFPNTDTNICPTMVRSTSHKHMNKEWIRKVQKNIFKCSAS